ncbi:MAG: plasmid pRiA4b ORF-3 family protein [Clostridium sp.]|nr:plasmid pRiA4b ORF-3 family protein [Clostridium sp.]
MQICCTKKLFEESHILTEKVPPENDLFCWSAHFIIVNRRKTVVVVNDSSGLGFVLYGLKTKDFSKLAELILKGIKNSLKAIKIREEVIEQYIKTAGKLTFTKTRGPRYVALINKASQLVKMFSEKLDSNVLYQPTASKMIREDFIKVYGTKNYRYTYEILIEKLKKFAGENIIKCEAFDLIIKLNLRQHKCWRRIVVPNDFTFKQFHKILQVLFNWQNYHLYDFDVFDEKGNCILKIMDDDDEIYNFQEGYKILLSAKVKLLDFFKKNCKVIYNYDFGDGWKHEIVSQSTIYDYDKNHPICLMGEGISPPEDVGGDPGYEDFLKIISDTNNEEYERICQWAESQGYTEFNIDLVNTRLKYILA